MNLKSSLFAIVVVLSGIGSPTAAPVFQNGPEDHCSPATVASDPSAGCVSSLTGCICTTSGSAVIVTYGGCEGCKFTINGTTACSQPSKPIGTSRPFNCTTTTGCGGAATCGGTCPCNGTVYYPFILTCGECTDF